MTLFVICLFAALAVIALTAWKRFGILGAVGGAALYVAAWIIVEIATAIIFYTYGVYVSRKV